MKLPLISKCSITNFIKQLSFVPREVFTSHMTFEERIVFANLANHFENLVKTCILMVLVNASSIYSQI